MPSDTGPARVPEPRVISCLGTPLTVTDHAGALALCLRLARGDRPAAVEFCNTQIVTLRRSDPDYRAVSRAFDHFIPDSSPLLWLLNAHGAGMGDRVYGPAFFDHALRNSPAGATHYLIGGSEACGTALREKYTRLNPDLRIVGTFHGRCDAGGRLGSDDEGVHRELLRLEPDFVWVGLGTPKQQRWIARAKPLLGRGTLLSVGQAFDVNAGLRSDAPAWMQRLGLTWLYRMASEPRRLAGRYVRHNSEFLGYLVADLVRGRIYEPSEPDSRPGGS